MRQGWLERVVGDFLSLVRLLVFERMARQYVWKDRMVSTLFVGLVLPLSVVIPGVQLGRSISDSGPPESALARLFSQVVMFGCATLLLLGFLGALTKFDRPLGPDERYLWRTTDPSRAWMLRGALLIRGSTMSLLFACLFQAMLFGGLLEAGERWSVTWLACIDALLWFTVAVFAGAFFGESLQAWIGPSRLRKVYYLGLVLFVLIVNGLLAQVGAALLAPENAWWRLSPTDSWGRQYAAFLRSGGFSGKAALASIRVLTVCLLGYGLMTFLEPPQAGRPATARVGSGLRRSTRRWQAFLAVQALSVRRQPSKFLVAYGDTLLLAGLFSLLAPLTKPEVSLMGLALLVGYSLFRATLVVVREMGTERSLILAAKRAPNSLVWYLVSKWVLAWFAGFTAAALVCLWGYLWWGPPVVGLWWVVVMFPPLYSLVAAGLGARFGYYKDRFTGISVQGLVVVGLSGALLEVTVLMLATVSGLAKVSWTLGVLATSVWGLLGIASVLSGLRRLRRLEI